MDTTFVISQINVCRKQTEYVHNMYTHQDKPFRDGVEGCAGSRARAGAVCRPAAPSAILPDRVLTADSRAPTPPAGSRTFVCVPKT